ncbi:MAG: PAS domain S-box protein [Bacteroidota bacterium]|nr:PAS domain S-box protein [Bacteroidota bacterium]
MTKVYMERQKINGTLQSLKALEDVMDDVQDIDASQRGYIISGKKEFLEPYYAALKKLGNDTGALKGIIRLYPERKEAIVRLSGHISKKIVSARASLALIDQADHDSAYQQIHSGAGRILMDSIRHIITSFENEDRFMLRDANTKRGQAAKATAILFVILGAVFITGLVIVFWRMKRGLKQREIYEQKITYLAGLTEKTSDAIFSLDLEGRIISWNKGAELIYGYTKEEVIGKFAPDITRSGLTKETFTAIVNKVPIEGSLDVETLNYNKNGEPIHCLSSITALKNETGKLIGYVIVLRDITQRKQNEELLSKFNEELKRQVEEKTTQVKNILERISDGFYSLDANWNFTYMNYTAAEIMNCRPEDIVGKNLWKEYPQATEQSMYQTFLKSFEEQQYKLVEFYYPPYKKWFKVHIYPSPTGISVFFRDISGLKKAEEDIRHSNERFEMITRTTNDAVWEWNLETGELWGNETHQQLYGLTLADPVPLEKEWENRIHPDEREALTNKKANALASDTNIIITEYRFNTEQYGYKHIYDRCYIVRNTEGKAIRILGSMMDVTELKKAEEKLKRREIQLLASIENTPNVAVQWYNDKGEVLFWNHASELIFGWGATEAMGKTLDQLIFTPDETTAFIETIRLIEQTGRTIGPSEFSFRRRNGSQGYCVATIFSIPSIDGSPCYVCMDIDITENKNASEGLRESEEKYRSMIEQASDSIFIIDKKSMYIDANHAACLLVGYTKQEILDLSSSALLTEEEIPIGQLKGNELQSGEPVVMERKLRKKNGVIIDTEASYKLLSNGYVLIIARDITEKKKAEQAIRASEETRKLIMNAALDAIVCTDTTGIVTVWTPQAERIFGWAEQEILGKKLTETIIPEEFRERHKKGMQHYLATGKGPILNRLIELAAINKEGRIFPIELSIIPVKQDETEFFCAFIRDITERKEAAEKIVREKELSDTAINSLPGIFYIFDNDRKFLRWNKNFETVSGYISEEIPMVNPLDFFADEDKELAELRVTEIFQKGSSELEAHFQTKTGEKILYFFTGLAINYEGKPCMLGTGIDIAELRRTQQNYSTLVNTIDGIVWEADAKNFHFSFVSKQAERLLGYPAERWVNEPSFWADHIHPEDRNWAVEYCARSTQKKKAHEFEYRMIAADGRIVWLRDIISVIVEDDKPVRLRGIMVDITEQKKSEEDIVKSNARFQMVSKATSDIVWDWDIVNDSLWWNDNYYSGLDYEKYKEIVHIEEWLNNIHPDDVEQVKRKTGKSFESAESTWRDAYRYRKADGTYLHFLDRGFIIRDKNGKAIRMIGSMVDMSPVYESQKRIAESEEKYRTLVEQAVDAIALYDATGKILDVNTGSVNLLGYTKEELMQMSLPDILTKEEILGKPVQYDVLRDGKSTVKQRKMKKKDGSIVETEVRSQQLPDGRFLSVIRDLTEREKAQQQIEREKELSDKLIDSLPGVFYWYDENGKFLRWNRLFEYVTGYSGKEIAGMHPTDFFEGEGLRHISEKIKEVFSKGLADAEAEFVSKDGSRLPYYFKALRIIINGKPSLLGTGIDISDRKKAEKELDESYNAIRKLTGHLQDVREEERTHIAREIHDELGQQLTVLKMDVSWLNKRIASTDDAIKQKMKSLLTMLDETVQSVRRISSELRPSLLDDLGLTAAIEWQLAEFEKRSGIRTHFNSDVEDVGLNESVKTALFRVFQESLTNVARHSDARNVTVSFISVRNHFVLSIADDGKGFDKQKIADKRTLGILGMKERTAMINGTYEIKSSTGKGTAVIVKVPFTNH